MTKFLLFLPLLLQTVVAAAQDSMSAADTIAKPAIDTMFRQNVSLSEIVVKGKKPPVAFKLDRQVFKASEFATAANGTATDLIKNLPSVSVNGQGEINVRGSASFQVLINGRPTQADPAFVLSQIPASSIESIEMISTPGAAFDADGKAGIMNIITKTAPEQGLMVQSNVMIGAPPIQDFDNQRYRSPQRHAIDLSIGYQKGGWDFSTGFNYLRNDMAGYREGDVNTTFNNIFTSFPSNGERSYKRYHYGARFAAGYQVNMNHRIEGSAFLGNRFQSRVADLVYENSRMDLLTGQTSRFTYFNENTAQKEGLFSLASIGSNHKISNSTSLAFSLQYEGADLEGLTTNKNLSYPIPNTLYQETINPSTNPLQAYRFKTDLTNKKGNRAWQAGYQFRHDNQRGDFVYKYRDLGQTEFTIDPAFTSKVNVTNQIHAGYVQYSNVYGKPSYQAGLRAEYMLRDLDIVSTNEKTSLPLWNLFPSYLLKYQIARRTSIKHSYTRRIKRTNNFELNPFPEREHSETLEQGDPELLPELTGIWELGLEQKFSKGSFTATFYHQRVKNPIQRVNKVYNDTILLRIFTNAGAARQTGLETYFNYRIGKVWQMTVGGNVYKYDIEGELFNGDVAFSNGSWVYSINTNQNFTLPSNWQIQFSVNYLSLRATAQGEDGAFFTPNLSVKKTTNDNRWGFQLQWMYIDAGLGISNRQRITTFGSDFYSTTNYIYEPDQIQFSLSFNLARKNRKINLPESEMVEKEF